MKNLIFIIISLIFSFDNLFSYQLFYNGQPIEKIETINKEFHEELQIKINYKYNILKKFKKIKKQINIKKENKNINSGSNFIIDQSDINYLSNINEVLIRSSSDKFILKLNEEYEDKIIGEELVIAPEIKISNKINLSFQNNNFSFAYKNYLYFLKTIFDSTSNTITYAIDGSDKKILVLFLPVDFEFKYDSDIYKFFQVKFNFKNDNYENVFFRFNFRYQNPKKKLKNFILHDIIEKKDNSIYSPKVPYNLNNNKLSEIILFFELDENYELEYYKNLISSLNINFIFSNSFGFKKNSNYYEIDLKNIKNKHLTKLNSIYFFDDLDLNDVDFYIYNSIKTNLPYDFESYNKISDKLNLPLLKNLGDLSINNSFLTSMTLSEFSEFNNQLKDLNLDIHKYFEYFDVHINSDKKINQKKNSDSSELYVFFLDIILIILLLLFLKYNNFFLSKSLFIFFILLFLINIFDIKDKIILLFVFIILYISFKYKNLIKYSFNVYIFLINVIAISVYFELYLVREIFGIFLFLLLLNHLLIYSNETYKYKQILFKNNK